jgi:hypothetical protein
MCPRLTAGGFQEYVLRKTVFKSWARASRYWSAAMLNAASCAQSLIIRSEVGIPVKNSTKIRGTN